MNVNIEAMHKLIEQHEQRIQALEKLLTKKPATSIVAAEQTSLPDRIIQLRDEGFFSELRTSNEVYEKLDVEMGYHCESSRVATALVRLADRRMLRTASKMVEGKMYKGYTW